MILMSAVISKFQTQINFYATYQVVGAKKSNTYHQIWQRAL